jgi:Fe-S cluster assembly protein SufD
VSPLEAARDRYLALIEAAAAERRAEPGWLAGLRREAAAAFAASGLPHVRLEEWRYTNVAPLARIPFALAPRAAEPISREALEAVSFPVYACSLFVFVDGVHRPELSTPRALSGGVRVESLASLLASEPERLAARLGRLVDAKTHPFAALNTALFGDGAVLLVPRGARLAQPVHLVFASSGAQPDVVVSPRVVVVAEPGSRADVIVDHVGLAAVRGFTNAVHEIWVEQAAELGFVLVQRESDELFHVANLAASVARDGRLAAHTLSLDGAFVRNDASVRLAEEGAVCRLNGLSAGDGEQLLDHHTLIDHAVPHGTSRQLYKSILGGSARGVFRGRVIVRPHAQHTDAEQSNPNLLLSTAAEVDSKPQLEIHADDVKCRHGASIGRLDENALFFLRARGLDEPAARALLTRGFAAEILDTLPVPALGTALSALLGARLAGAIAEARS